MNVLVLKKHPFSETDLGWRMNLAKNGRFGLKEAFFLQDRPRLKYESGCKWSFWSETSTLLPKLTWAEEWIWPKMNVFGLKEALFYAKWPQLMMNQIKNECFWCSRITFFPKLSKLIMNLTKTESLGLILSLEFFSEVQKAFVSVTEFFEIISENSRSLLLSLWFFSQASGDLLLSLRIFSKTQGAFFWVSNFFWSFRRPSSEFWNFLWSSNGHSMDLLMNQEIFSDVQKVFVSGGLLLNLNIFLKI